METSTRTAMNAVDKALQTQITNIQERTGKSLDDLFAMLGKSGLEKHGELRDKLKGDLGMGHGDANTVVHLYRERTAPGPSAAGDPVDAIYDGAKADLRPIHEAIMDRVTTFGDFEVAPKKAYVSLRRKKQFAMVGPATKTQVEVGLNMKGVTSTERLVEQKPGGMCQYKVRLSSPAEVDEELLGWLRTAYDRAG
jgi:hypothetical protein